MIFNSQTPFAFVFFSFLKGYKFVLQVHVRTTGLFYRLADRVVSQGDRIRELEGKDRSLEEKLQDIERKLGDVKAGGEGLMFELQKSMDVAREGTSAMEDLGKKFDEGQAIIVSLEAQNAMLAEQIISASEKATIKARYDILMDYKEGLFDEAKIDEEFGMFEEDFPDEAKRSSADLASAPIEAGRSNVEPPVQADLCEARETQE